MITRQRGMTLIETLVAGIVLAIGMIGIVSMDAFSIRKNHEAYLRTQAILQAHEMADRMHANPVGVTDGHYASAFPGSEPSPNCLAASCTPAEMAAFDKWEWKTATTEILPGASVTITESSGAYTITVSWVEDSNVISNILIDGQSFTGDSQTKSFSFVYKPLPLSVI
jgi:type IV pilus assembly protein PilV